MTFNPEESIDFNGNTGPFIQYTYVRIISMLQKAGHTENNADTYINVLNDLEPAELSLLKMIYEFEDAVREAAEKMNSSVIANYLYELAKEFNKFYHDIPAIIKEENTNKLQQFLSSMQNPQSIVNAVSKDFRQTPLYSVV